MSNKLLPCPFCGSNDVSDHWISWGEICMIKCNNIHCGAEEPPGNYDEAEKKWNERKSEQPR